MQIAYYRVMSTLSVAGTLEGSPDLLIVEFCVAQGRARIAVTKHRLRRFQAMSILKQLSAAGVAQLVERVRSIADGIDQVGRPTNTLPPIAEGVIRDPGTVI